METCKISRIYRLESENQDEQHENQDEQFQDIDEAGMQDASGAYLQSQQWKSATPFFDMSTPVLPSRPLYAASEVPNAPHI
jgi:hypothetical protein